MSINPNTDRVPPFQTTWARTSDLLRLTKPKLLSLVLFTTMVGFCTANAGPMPMLLLANTLIGTALIAGGATACNMYRERKLDARMKRTALRPLASGRLPLPQAMFFALVLSAGGLSYLFSRVNRLTGILAALVFACYLFLYTPLKTKTWLSVFVGAVPGAVPVVMGWTAASGRVSRGAWILFAIVFLWQVPHFFSIGWMHRDDYANAGLPVISVVDRDGRKTGRLAVQFVVVLVGVTLLPFLWSFAGRTYCAGAVILGLIFLGCAIRFATLRDTRSARALFMVSALYLPALFVFLVLDKSVTR
ncbi:MAG TPA: heme o synthase [Acidobacteriota bacterium]|nr:heme o synthase [Acidobacteriota bacterium]